VACDSCGKSALITELLAGIMLAPLHEELATVNGSDMPWPLFFQGKYAGTPENFVTKIEPCHNGIQIDHLAVAVEGVMPVQQDLPPSRRRYLCNSATALTLSLASYFAPWNASSFAINVSRRLWLVAVNVSQKYR
jgi:hypothetical protein